LRERGLYLSEILEGEPPEWAKEADWEMVEEKAKTEILAGTTYELSWDSPRQAEIRLKMSLRIKNRLNPPRNPFNRRSTGQKGRYKKSPQYRLKTAARKSARRIGLRAAKGAFCRIYGARRRGKRTFWPLIRE
jgi:hypothetical protein